MNARLETRAGALFLEVTELPQAERGAFLERECGQDEGLRRRVQELLELELNMPEAFLNGSPRAPAHYLEPGANFAGFQILRRIGEGGMGTVYAALQSMPKREVALKVIRPGRMSDQAQRRFRHEVEVLGNLQHPGIAQIYEAGTASTVDEQGRSVEQPYLAMELVRGEPLLAYARLNGLGIMPRLELLARICDAIHHAHQRAVIHRDLKPENVLVTGEESTAVADSDASPGGVGRPMILDFGIARVLDRDDSPYDGETRADELIGTLSYMSPERLGGNRAAVDVRSDVYALGVMLYQLLADRLPIDIAGDDLARAVQRLQTEAEPPLESVDPHLRGDVSIIAHKALEKDPDRRYQSALELATDLRHHLRGEPIRARSDSALYLLRRRLRRHRVMLTVTAGILVLVVGFAVLFAIQSRENKLLAENEAHARALSDEDYRDALASVQLLTHVSQERLKNVPLADEARRELLRAALDFHLGLLERHQDDPSLHERTLRTRQSVARIQLDLGNLSEARDQAQRLLDEGPWQTTPGAAAELHLDALQLLGASSRMLGDLEAGKRAFADAIDLAHAHLDISLESNYREVATAQRFLALLLSDEGQAEEAEALLVSSLVPFESEDGGWSTVLEDAEVLADNLMRLGIIRAQRSHWEAAEEAYEAALEVVLGILAEHPQDLEQRLNRARLYTNLGAVAADREDFEGAMESHAQAIAAAQALLDEHPTVPRYAEALFVAHNNMFYALHALDESTRAVAHSERAGELLELRSKLQPNSVPLLVQRVFHGVNAGAMLLGIERPIEAVGVLEAALEVSAEITRIAPSEVTHLFAAKHARLNLGLARLELGESGAAVEAIQAISFLVGETEMGLALNVLSRAIYVMRQDDSAGVEANEADIFGVVEVANELIQRSINEGFDPKPEFWDSTGHKILVVHPDFEFGRVD